MTSSADVLNVARSYLGVAENPAHSNRTIIGEKFGWNGVAWCAESVTVWQHEAGNSAFNGSASCSVLVGRYRDGSNGTWGVDPEPGDEGFLGSSGGDHTFLIESNNGNGTVTTIEGNWGDKVTRVTRAISSIYGFGRPNYDGAAAPDLPPPSSTGGRPLLRQGSTGNAVKAVQDFLNAFHGAGIQADSDFGPATEAAVVTYQHDRGLTADGVVGPQTYADMDAVVAYCAGLAAGAQVDNIPGFPGTTKLGSRGDAVRQVQQRLIDRGWSVAGGADGVFGKGTQKVVISFQQEKGLDADGVVGPLTWTALWTAPVS